MNLSLPEKNETQTEGSLYPYVGVLATSPNLTADSACKSASWNSPSHARHQARNIIAKARVQTPPVLRHAAMVDRLTFRDFDATRERRGAPAIVPAEHLAQAMVRQRLNAGVLKLGAEGEGTLAGLYRPGIRAEYPACSAEPRKHASLSAS